MKIRSLSLFLLITLLLASCNVLPNMGVRVIKPSDVIISEDRDVSDFSAIEFSTLGKVIITQGDQESLNISGPDNLVPEIKTTVQNGTLIIENKENIAIENKENITINPLGENNPLTFTIVVKELTSLGVNGAGDVQIETLSTPSINIDMSGAGKLNLNQITTDKLEVNFSGLGNIDMSGQATQGDIYMSGAGNVNAAELQMKTAEINLSGLGGTTLWVTDQLTGEISGAGSVSYYGSPQTNFSTSGLGKFISLGSK